MRFRQAAAAEAERRPAAGCFTLHVDEHCEVLIQALSGGRLLYPPISVPMTGDRVQLTIVPAGAPADHGKVTEGNNMRA